ncbi:MAG: 4-hydroxy-tetrahydrodipicolinate synthase [Pseudomonadales bacterium]|nr:4-hydroxy-tetrahydrodipicolinate synthase [Pseudomonadales bacterium]
MIRGSMVALVTPMQADGGLDEDALRQLVAWHVQEGTDAIVAVGTTGESATLNVEEHLHVIDLVIKAAAGQIKVIAGTGANSTREAIELTEAAFRLNVDACLLVTPYYNKPTQEGLVRHYRAIAERVPVAQILYNVPGRTGVDMINETVLRLAGMPHIVGIKDATGNIRRGAELIHALAGRMAVYSGDDATAGELMLQGAQGNISVTANVAPHAMAELCKAAMIGDVKGVERWDSPLRALHRDLFVESNPIPVKWALHAMGRIDEGIRLPLTWLSESAQSVVALALQQAGLL